MAAKPNSTRTADVRSNLGMRNVHDHERQSAPEPKIAGASAAIAGLAERTVSRAYIRATLWRGAADE